MSALEVLSRAVEVLSLLGVGLGALIGLWLIDVLDERLRSPR